jgi:glucose/arabinose dehydrogenase/PKD repeat protein
MPNVVAGAQRGELVHVSSRGGIPVTRSQPVRLLFLLLFVAASLIMGTLPTQAQGPALPAGFSDALVAPIRYPTALAFVPDGRVLVTEHGGVMRVLKDGKVLNLESINLKDRVCGNSERGLIGVAVDPNFALNKHIYLFYTRAVSQTMVNGVLTPYCPYNEPQNPQNPVNRLSRFTLLDNNKVDLASERVILDNIYSLHGNHNAGDLHFGKDGYLYISVGDAGCDWKYGSKDDPTRGGCADSNGNTREPFLLNGKILRIRSDGSIPPDNPWANDPNAVVCGLNGRTTTDKKCKETYAWGLRNPFRIALDPNTPAPQRIYANDVGQRSWEEINDIVPGAFYGWNLREGFCKRENFSIRDCRSVPGATVNGDTDPIFAYHHPAITATTEISGVSITGGAFVPNGLWSSEYDGDFLFGDFEGWIGRLEPKAGGGYKVTKFGSRLGPVVAMKFGDYQGKPALYYSTYANKGELRVITFNATNANRTPNARVEATPIAGPKPLLVTFNGAASSDLDGDTLTYLWDFGNGQTAQTTTPTTTHTYAADGVYTATLRVRDPKDAISQPVEIPISVGNELPTPTILSPTTAARYSVGEEIVLEGSASDPEDGALAGEQLTWQVMLHHDDHTHPWVQPTAGSRVTFTTPPPEDISASTTSWLEIILQATDSAGLTTVITQELRPKLVNVTLDSLPAGATLEVNAVNITTPRTLVAWPGWDLRVNVPNQLGPGNTPLAFAGWTDNVGGALRSIITPDAPSSVYTARLAPPPQPAISAPPSDLRYRVGQSITLEGSAIDHTGAALGADQLRWRVILHSGGRSTEVAGPLTGASATFSAPAPLNLATVEETYLEIELAATNAAGATGIITRELRPMLVDVAFTPTPTGATVLVNNTPISSPTTLRSIPGYVLLVQAPKQSVGGQELRFAEWSDGGQASHSIVTADEPTSYTARFVPSAEAPQYSLFFPVFPFTIRP